MSNIDVDLKKCRKLIQEDKLKEAFMLLSAHSKLGDKALEVESFRAQYSSNMSSFHLGEITIEQRQVTENRIRSGILKLLNTLEKKEDVLPSKEGGKKRLKRIVYVLGLLLFLFLIWGWSGLENMFKKPSVTLKIEKALIERDSLVFTFSLMNLTSEEVFIKDINFEKLVNKNVIGTANYLSNRQEFVLVADVLGQRSTLGILKENSVSLLSRDTKTTYGLKPGETERCMLTIFMPKNQQSVFIVGGLSVEYFTLNSDGYSVSDKLYAFRVDDISGFTEVEDYKLKDTSILKEVYPFHYKGLAK